MRSIKPPVLFELHAENGGRLQRPECRGLAPLARRHALVSTEARLACPVDIPNWSAWQDLHLQPFRLERNVSSNWTTRGGAPGQSCTDTVRGLSPPPLRWATGAD
jgi:hypothetical protein